MKKRLVDLDLLTEQILAYARNGKNPEWININDVLCVLDDGQLIIEEQPKLGEWISVDDRLPEKDGIYIICDRRLSGKPWIHTAGFKSVSNSWCENHGVYYDDGYGRYDKQDKVTHWQPLPGPPKESDE